MSDREPNDHPQAPPHLRGLSRHFADLRDGTHGNGAVSRGDKERLFADAVSLLDPYARQALAELNDTLLLGTGTVAATGTTPSPDGGVAVGWCLSWPEQEARKIPPVTLEAVFGRNFLHPHLRGGTVGVWPLNVFSDADAAAELATLRAIAAADLHNLVFQADYRIIPATVRGVRAEEGGVAGTRKEGGPTGGKRQIAVVGSSDDRMEPAVSLARELGELLAREGWTVLSGGRDVGVMRAVNEGAKRVAGSLTVGILPGTEPAAAPGVDVVLVTGMGNARNNVIVLSAEVVVACGIDGPGTASEVALALKNGTPVVLLAPDDAALAFFRRLAGGKVTTAATPQEAVELVRAALSP